MISKDKLFFPFTKYSVIFSLSFLNIHYQPFSSIFTDLLHKVLNIQSFEQVIEDPVSKVPALHLTPEVSPLCLPSYQLLWDS